ncbi:MAG: hypothetical protein ACYC3I_03855 [Gemmataceae bacterium]
MARMLALQEGEAVLRQRFGKAMPGQATDSAISKDERTKLVIASPQRKQGKELPLLAPRAGEGLSARPKSYRTKPRLFVGTRYFPVVYALLGQFCPVALSSSHSSLILP